MSSVFIATPTTRAFETGFVASLAGTQAPESRYWSVLEGQPVDLARNMLVERFLKTNYDYILFCDSDATWHPNAIQRLLERGKEAICAIFFHRRLPPVPTMGPYAGIGVNGRPVYHFGQTCKRIVKHAYKHDLGSDVDNHVLLEKSDDDLFEIDGCGSHFFMVHRDVLEKIEPPYFQKLTAGAGEDFYFCQKIRNANVSIYADLSVYTGHIAGPGINLGLREFLTFYSQKLINEDDETWNV